MTKVLSLYICRSTDPRALLAVSRLDFRVKGQGLGLEV